MFLLAALSVAHAADDFGVTLSLAGGWYFTDPLENLDQTWSGVPRLGWEDTMLGRFTAVAWDGFGDAGGAEAPLVGNGNISNKRKFLVNLMYRKP